ncbi:uncharacterized protein [Leptinotarsa decemlineata]|uniref:uncharacterized protein n=1 Tax=Leptinotarsa decemlineata TaxID=7539 RepID=UPI003D30A6C8
MAQIRKRGRHHLEEEVEFMPLSKRINNLHINNPMLLENTPSNPVEWGPGPPGYGTNLPGSGSTIEPRQNFNMPQYHPQYSPGLNENQNPHYFNINKLLFEMYIQRIQRGCHQT